MPQISVIVDNKSLSSYLGSEHGLSMLIKLDNGRQWLWDTGQSELFIHNARALNLDPGQIHGLALSHGHYDHTGGLDILLASGFKGYIYAHPCFARSRFHVDAGNARSIGLKTNNLPRIIKHHVPVESVLELDHGLIMLTSITRKDGNFQAVDGFFQDMKGEEPDLVPDDAVLVLEDNNRAVLILGCCHSGLKNTCEYIEEKLGIREYHTLIGGLHLSKGYEKAYAQTLATIKEYGFNRVYPGHCTGEKAILYLQEKLGAKVLPMGAGLVVDM